MKLKRIRYNYVLLRFEEYYDGKNQMPIPDGGQFLSLLTKPAPPYFEFIYNYERETDTRPDDKDFPILTYEEACRRLSAHLISTYKQEILVHELQIRNIEKSLNVVELGSAIGKIALEILVNPKT